MPGTNLTRDEAQTRAAPPRRRLVHRRPRPDDCRQDLRVRPRSRLHLHASPARAPSSTWSARRPRDHAQRPALDPSTSTPTAGSRLDDLAGRQRAAWCVADCPTATPARACTASSTRSTSESTSTPSSRCRTRAACSPLRAARPEGRLHLHGHGAGDWQVVSNAADAGARGRSAAATPVWHFRATEPMSTYITALVAGQYHVVRDTYEGSTARSRSASSAASRWPSTSTPTTSSRSPSRASSSSRSAFDMPYPFGKYDQLFVPEYNAGAMENAGCVTLATTTSSAAARTALVYEHRANTILHEMAHMWFGDLVTMSWWDDLWLNESFAEWACTTPRPRRPSSPTRGPTSPTPARPGRYRQDQLPSTHPIAADNHDLEAVEVNFDGITYAKGASVLKQLVAWVGQERSSPACGILRGARLGQHRARRPAQALEETSGRDLDSWAKEWLETVGRQHAPAAFEVDADGRFTSFAVGRRRRRLPDAAPAPARRRPLRPRRRRLVRRERRRARRRRRRDRASPSWSASRSPTCCCSTTTTSPTPRSGSTSARWPPWSATSPASTTRWPGRCAGGRPGT